MRLTPLLILLAALPLTACRGNDDKSAGSTSGSTTVAPAPAPVDPTLTVTARAPAVGDKSEDKQASEMVLELSIKAGAKPKEIKLTQVETQRKTEEVLAVDGKAITKAKITYAEKTKSETEDGKEKKQPRSPIEGKTYILEMKGAKLEITGENGKKVSPAEDKAVRADANDFGQPDPLLAAMPSAPLKVGEKVEALSTALQKLIQSRDDSKEKADVKDVVVTLTAIEGSGPDTIGVFSLALTVSTPEKSKSPFAIKAPLAGTMKIRARDGWATAVALSGPIEMSSGGSKNDISAKGTMKLVFDATR